MISFNLSAWVKRLSLLLLLGSFFTAGLAKADDFQVASKHAIAVEANTGKILYEKDANQATEIASITKLVTIYLVYQHIKEGKLSWDSQVAISDYPYELTTDSEASNVPMEARSYTVKQLVDASLIASANSAAIALAEKIAGSEPKFVDQMRELLKSWGISDATLVNASGLNNSMLNGHIYPNSGAKAENKMSARDVALVARHLIQDFPQVLEITSQPQGDFAGTVMTSSNQMLLGLNAYRQGVDGLKTGTTILAGASFVATAKQKGMRVITVVLNADNSDNDPLARFTATNQLLDYVYDKFELRTVLEKGQSYQKQLAIQNGKEKTVSAIAKKTFQVVQEKKQKLNSSDFKLTSSSATAPIKKGQTLAHISYQDPNKVGKSGYLAGAPKVALLAEKEVKRSWLLTFKKPITVILLLGTPLLSYVCLGQLKLRRVKLLFTDLALPLYALELPVFSKLFLGHNWLPYLLLALLGLAIILAAKLLVSKQGLHSKRFIKLFWRFGFILAAISYLLFTVAVLLT